MDVEPANVNQIRAAAGGRFVEIHRDVGGVVDALKQIDPGFGVRFPLDAADPYWHVYHSSEDGRSTELVLSAQAHQNASGVWEGLDMRVIERVMRIGSEDYDFAREVERRNQAARRAEEQRTSEQIREKGELVAHAIRKDLGVKTRAFIKGKP
jgi:hypothetical protein